MIYYKNGDVIEIAESYQEKVIIPHIVNNVDKFGSGFAKALPNNHNFLRCNSHNRNFRIHIMNKWPVVKKQYHLFKQHQVLGEILPISVGENITVINMCAQNGVISVANKTPIRYDALEACLEKTQNQYPSELIVCPKFGSGLAGGDWNKIVSLINKHWDRKVIVCSL